MADKETYILLDARGLVLHGYLQGKDPDGELDDNEKVINTPGYGMERILSTYYIFDEIPPRRIIAVWDAGNDYRTALYSGYKAKRRERQKLETPAQKAAASSMMDAAKQLFDGLGITQVSVAGVEADDVIAYLCSKLPSTVVFTLDQDLVQLQGDYPGTKVVLRNEFVGETHKDIPLKLIRLYKSIVGDSTDEYPGIVGMGDKAFFRLLKNYGEDGLLDLDAIISSTNWSALREIADGVADKDLTELYTHREHWALQYLLASLNPALCEGVRNNKIVKLDWRRRVPAHYEVRDLEKKIGLRGLYDRFAKWLPNFTLANNDSAGNKCLNTFLSALGDGPIVAFDYETVDTLKHRPFKEAKKSGDYVDVISSEPTGVSFAYGDNYQHVFYMPCGHRDTANFMIENVAWAVNAASQKAQLVAHNAPFEYGVTAVQFGIELPTPWDTRLMASHVDENDSLHLKDLSRRWLSYAQESYKEVLTKTRAADMSELTGKQVLNYGCDDSLVTAHLFDLFWLITTVEGTWPFIRDEEFLFIHEQTRGFLAGVNGDMDVIARLDAEAVVTIAESTARIRELLTLHCSDYNVAGAQNLFDELVPFTRACLVADGKTTEQVEEALDRLWDKVSEGARYIPPQQVETEGDSSAEFKPTAKRLTEVAVKLDLPPIEKVTKQYLNWWVGNCQETVSRVEWEDQQPEGGVQAGNTFIDLLGNAVHALKSREGSEYEALAAFCLQTAGEKPSTKTASIGDELNFGSSQQMQSLLYAKLGLPIRIRGKVDRGSRRDQLKFQGSASTNALAVSAALANDVEHGSWQYDVLTHYGKVKTASTAKSLFYDTLPLWVHPADGKIHPQILNCGTVTRRPSGSSPNFLQLNKKDGGELRGFVRPYDETHVIVSADIAGQELRITAGESQDPVMLDAYCGEVKKDLHGVTAASIAPSFFRLQEFRREFDLPDEYASVFSVSYEEFIEALSDDELSKPMKAIRKSAKAVNFLINYLGGYTTLARRLQIKDDLAKQLMNQTFARYSRLKPWQDEVIAFARSHGYTETAYGSRRHLGPDLFSTDDGLRTRMERQACNAIVQGGAADFLKKALAKAYRESLFEDTGAYMIAPVYDEIASSVPLASVWEYCSRLKKLLEVVYPAGNVPMVAEFSLSAVSWGRLVEIGADITEDKVMAALEKSKGAI